MGTSADNRGGSGGAWTPLKRATTNYAKSAASGGGGDRAAAAKVLGKHVAVLGGATSAANGARVGRSTLASLGGFLASVGSTDLGTALRRMGLEHLVGQDRFDVLDELVTAIGGSGSDLDSQAARDAECDVLEALFAEATLWEDLETTTVSAEYLEIDLALPRSLRL